MTMSKRTIQVSAGVFIFALTTAVFAGTGRFSSPPAPACDGTDARATRVALLAEERVTIAGDSLVATDDGSAVALADVAGCTELAGDGVLRHLASGPAALAVVNDLAGRDQLLTIGPDGIESLDTHGEVTHPAWAPDGKLVWAEDFELVRMVSADRTLVTSLVAPDVALGAFYPVFDGDDGVVAVLQEPSPAIPEEDDGLDNLWRFDLVSQRWARLTHFEPSPDRWFAIRTPVPVGGTVYFVLVSADPDQTRAPRFELWRAGDTVEEVRPLAADTYLAGTDGDDLLFNAPSRQCNGWGLFVERAGELEPIGCGAITVDPLDVDDPDLAITDEHGDEAASGGGAILAIVIGDFGSRAAAERFTARLGDGRVVDDSYAPGLVRPGGWVVVRDLPVDAEPEVFLELTRAQLGKCSCGAWLAPLP